MDAVVYEERRNSLMIMSVHSQAIIHSYWDNKTCSSDPDTVKVCASLHSYAHKQHHRRRPGTWKSTGEHLQSSKQQAQRVAPNNMVAVNAAAVWTESLPFVRLSRQHSSLQAKEHERQLVLGRRRELEATQCVLDSKCIAAYFKEHECQLLHGR